MMLTTFFPSTKHFLVKPQAWLQDPPEPGGHRSNDSYGQIVGTSNKNANPNFLVITGTSMLDVPFLIYEIKKMKTNPYLPDRWGGSYGAGNIRDMFHHGHKCSVGHWDKEYCI